MGPAVVIGALVGEDGKLFHVLGSVGCEEEFIVLGFYHEVYGVLVVVLVGFGDGFKGDGVFYHRAELVARE